jgi:hypothetical protein
MQKVVKTQYMDKAQRGYSEYFFYDEEARNSVSPVPGDRGFMKDGSLYFCWETGQWDKIGG